MVLCYCGLETGRDDFHHACWEEHERRYRNRICLKCKSHDLPNDRWVECRKCVDDLDSPYVGYGRVING